VVGGGDESVADGGSNERLNPKAGQAEGQIGTVEVM